MYQGLLTAATVGSGTVLLGVNSGSALKHSQPASSKHICYFKKNQKSLQTSKIFE